MTSTSGSGRLKRPLPTILSVTLHVSTARPAFASFARHVLPVTAKSDALGPVVAVFAAHCCYRLPSPSCCPTNAVSCRMPKLASRASSGATPFALSNSATKEPRIVPVVDQSAFHQSFGSIFRSKWTFRICALPL